MQEEARPKVAAATGVMGGGGDAGRSAGAVDGRGVDASASARVTSGATAGGSRS